MSITKVFDTAAAGLGLGACATLAAGIAMESQPIAVFGGLINVATATVISWPVVVAGAVVGAAGLVVARGVLEALIRKARYRRAAKAPGEETGKTLPSEGSDWGAVPVGRGQGNDPKPRTNEQREEYCHVFGSYSSRCQE